jgi:mRNA interferase MazF
MTLPARGEVWTVDLDPVRGHEQRGRRPSLVVSADRVNESPAGLVVVVPVTSVRKRSDFHVGVEPPEGGLRRSSYLKPEDLRSISIDRLGRRLGSVSRMTMHEIETRLRMVLDL